MNDGRASSRNGRVSLVVTSILLLLALGLHLAFFLTAGPLWRDEAHEVNFATMDSVGEVVSHLWMDSSPALYKLYLRVWSVLGDSDRVFRSSGLFIALLYLCTLVFFFGRGSTGRGSTGRGSTGDIPLLALTLPILSPVVIRQFDALRPYGLGILLSTLFYAFFLQYFRSRARSDFVLAAMVGVLAVNATYHACFFVLAACLSAALISVVIDRNRHAALLFLVLGVWPALGVLPYVPVVRKAGYWIVTQQESIPFAKILEIFRQAAGETTVTLALTLLVLIIFHQLGHRDARPGDARHGDARHGDARHGDARRDTESSKRSEALVGLCTLGFFVPLILGSFYASQILPTTLRFVYLLTLSALCLDVALRPLPPRWRAGLAVTLGLVVLVRFGPAFERVTVRQSNVDLIADKIAEMATADDLVLLRSWSSAISFARYHRGPAPIWTIPNLDHHQIHDYVFLRQKFEDPDPISDVLTALEKTLRGGHRVFMVGHFRDIRPERVLSPISPAPHPRYGWFKVPYLGNWEDQVSHFMLRHATRFGTMPPAPMRIDPREHLPLRVAVGWRDLPTPPRALESESSL